MTPPRPPKPPAGEPAPFNKIRFKTKYPLITLDGLHKVELVEGSGNGDGDIFFLTYTAADGKTYERYTNVAGLRPAERTAVLVFIGRYARTQAIRSRTKKRGKPADRKRLTRVLQSEDKTDRGEMIDLDSLIIEIPVTPDTTGK